MTTPHTPTDDLRDIVRQQTAAGLGRGDIAIMLGISRTTLARYYCDELRRPAPPTPNLARRGNAHVPTDETRNLVRWHAITGTLRPVICDILGISEDTLRRYYRDELDQGLAECNRQVATTLFRKAIGGDNQCMIFWLKTRALWRDKIDVDVRVDGLGDLLAEIGKSRSTVALDAGDDALDGDDAKVIEGTMDG